MIRAMVLAINPFIVDSVANILAGELCLDVLQLTYRQPQHVYEAIHDHRSVVIDVDEGQAVDELMVMPAVPASFWIDDPLLLIRIAVPSQGVRVFRSYPLANPHTDVVVKLVKGFCKDYLNKGSRVSVPVKPSWNIAGVRE
ncbi:MAG TPA: hypothetical protein VFR47_17815 [Anaerolineales bacterium]|nr:hypothetical protein [Anaerolineales bacterium]